MIHPMSSGTASRIAAGQIVKWLLELAASGLADRHDSLAKSVVGHVTQRSSLAVRGGSIAQAFRRLLKRGLIGQQITNGTATLSLSVSGRARLDYYYLNDLMLPERPSEWDGDWRVVFFDVPEERKVLRSVFRRKLKQFGFKYLQKSVWIYPYPCEDVLSVLAERLHMQRHIHVAVVRSLSSDALVRHQFSLSEMVHSVASSARKAAANFASPTAKPVQATFQSDRSDVSPNNGTVGSVGEYEMMPIDELD